MKLCALFLLALTAAVNGVSYYVATTGSATNSGSLASPWSLQYALTNATPTGGDTITVTAGTYTGAFTSLLAGSSAASPIKVIASGRATIDNGELGTGLRIFGSNVWFQGLEVMSSSTNRVDERQQGIYLASPGSKVINCIVHDCGSGILPVESAVGAEIYGCIVYNNGYQAAEPDRGHGHSMYIQNRDGTMLIKGNTCFNSFGWGLHIYGAEGRGIGIDMEGNVLFNAGAIAREGSNPNILVQPDYPADAVTIHGNYCYNSVAGSKNLDLGSTSRTYLGLTLTSNYLAGGFNEIKRWTTATITNNRWENSRQSLWWDDTQPFPAYDWDHNTINYSGPYQALTNSVNMSWADWKSVTGFDANSTLTVADPASTDVYTWQNAYDSNRVHVVAFNWPGSGTVSVDLSGLVGVGRSYSVRTVQNLYGSAVASGTYAGGSVTFPTSGFTVTAPVGMSAPAETGPVFNSFVVDVTNATQRIHIQNFRVGSMKVK